jgi:hypothetical protein
MSCANSWSDSGDRELDLGELTRGCCSSRELRPHRSDRCLSPVLTGADPSWVFARVNVWVISLLSRVAAVSSLGQFGAR